MFGQIFRDAYSTLILMHLVWRDFIYVWIHGGKIPVFRSKIFLFLWRMFVSLVSFTLEFFLSCLQVKVHIFRCFGYQAINETYSVTFQDNLFCRPFFRKFGGPWSFTFGPFKNLIGLDYWWFDLSKKCDYWKNFYGSQPQKIFFKVSD